MKTLKICFILLIQAAAAVGEEAELIPVSLGENVTLPCYSPLDSPIILVEWTRPDLVSPQYVFLYRDERSYTSFQHPSFAGRVELRDRQMKSGDVSLILRNVSSGDSGIYECRVSQGATRRVRRANIRAEPIRVINLEVEESEPGTRNHNRVAVGAVCALLVAAGLILVGVLKMRKHKTPVPSRDSSETTYRSETLKYP
ncbi:coxsackievirus and adenovirus receptor-like [Channa argus]|uniref:coxsackievirus and adenovirus receptor-like n=1 Tax=Channa argus TaxID=215402 RepID=UPI0035221D08